MKKRLTAAAAAVLTGVYALSAGAYTFPEPDWGALLKERESMVKETDFELYTQSGIDSAPYYGAKFEPRGGAYIGMIAERSEGYKPLGSYLTYIEDMYQPDFYYPANRMIQADNVITLAGWTIHDIRNINYDTIRSVLKTLNSYNKPILVRFANEMNTNVNGDDPSKYIEVFRAVADMVHEYDNLGTVWSPVDLGALDRNFEYFYPGDEYVDWVGISCYTKRYFGAENTDEYKSSVYFMTADYAWATNRVKPFMEFLERNNINKPVMISEGGVATGDVFGDRLDEWAAPRLRNMMYSLIMKYPQIKMINYFNIWRQESEYFNFDDHPYAGAIFKEAEESGAYIREYGGSPKFIYSRAEAGQTLTADSGGGIPLYTLAYIPGRPDITVNYSVDGAWYAMSDSIPYECRLNISGLSDGSHTLKISGYYQEKEYLFCKKGNRIRFGAEPDLADNGGDVVRVVLNGHTMSFEQPAIIKDERTLVPMRAIFEGLGAEVVWNGDTRSVNASKGNKRISMQIDNSTMHVNNSAVTLDVAPQIINDYTMVPVRAVSESLDCKVSWDGDTRTVYIYEPR